MVHQLTEQEYQYSVQRLQELEEFIRLQMAALVKTGLHGADLDRAMQPVISFARGIQEEIEAYEDMREYRAKHGPPYLDDLC